eukprot:sb/3464852/
MTLCLLRFSEISVRIKIDIVEQPCKVTALHHIGNYGGLGGHFFAADELDDTSSEVEASSPNKTDKEVIEEGEKETAEGDSQKEEGVKEEPVADGAKSDNEEKENAEDAVELTSNAFENDLLGAEKRSEEPKKEEPKKEATPPPPAAPKKIAPPPKIHKRDYEEPESAPSRPRIKWSLGIVKQLVSTELLSGMVETKLVKEEEPVKKRTTSRSEQAPSTQPKKQAKREEEDLDFEESENESAAEQEMEPARDPTAFPAPPLEPVGRSRKEENRALLIANLIRPFTVLQLKTMLSHCGKFATIEEAQRARESLHGSVWPSTSPKTLSVDFAEDERMYSETDGELIGDSIDIQVIEEQKRKKPKREKEAKETKKLDDIFKKTAAIPSVYWLPLSETEMYSETDGELIGDSIDIQVIEEQTRKKPKREKVPNNCLSI